MLPGGKPFRGAGVGPRLLSLSRGSQRCERAFEEAGLEELPDRQAGAARDRPAVAVRLVEAHNNRVLFSPPGPSARVVLTIRSSTAR